MTDPTNYRLVEFRIPRVGDAYLITDETGPNTPPRVIPKAVAESESVAEGIERWIVEKIEPCPEIPEEIVGELTYAPSPWNIGSVVEPDLQPTVIINVDTLLTYAHAERIKDIVHNRAVSHATIAKRQEADIDYLPGLVPEGTPTEREQKLETALAEVLDALNTHHQRSIDTIRTSGYICGCDKRLQRAEDLINQKEKS